MNSIIEKNKGSLILLVLLLLSSFLTAQGWERVYWGGGIVPPQPNINQAWADHVFVQNDGTYMFAGVINSDGKFVWTDEGGYVTNITDGPIIGSTLIKTSDGNYVNGHNAGSSVHLVKIDPNGNILWDNEFTYPFSQGTEYFSDVLQSDDGNYVFGGIRKHNIGLNEAEYLAYITKADEAGDVIWKTVTTFDSILQYSLTATLDGGYIMAGSSQNISQSYPLATVLMKFDQDGQLVWTKSMETQVQMREIVLTQDGGFAMVGKDTSGVDFKLVKVDSEGNDVWATDFPANSSGLSFVSSLITTDDNGFAFIGQVGSDIALIKTDATGNVLWQKSYGGAYFDSGHDLKQALDGGFVIGGLANQEFEDESFYIIKTDENGISFSNLIEGFVQYDINEDCINDSGEQALEDWIVSLEGNASIFYASVDANGYYSMEADTGIFDVKVEMPNAYWDPCVAVETVQLDMNFDTTQVDFAVQSIEQCPYMVVNMQVNGYVLCNERQIYVNCENQGTWLAEDVYVEITFDDSLEILGASVPYALISGNAYSFQIGDLDFLEEENFTVDVMVACDENLVGQTLCSEALIFPDTTCLPLDTNWSGASIEATAWCEGDSVKLKLENVGNAPMVQPLEYIVVEDDVIMMQEPYGALGIGDFIILTEEADGTFYRIESPQEPFHPGNSIPNAFIEACGEGENGEVSLGFVNQFPLNDLDPFIDILCQEVVSSFDPNIKVAFPEGFDTPHFIKQNTDIEYVIHFQNTGTAPANLVVIQDKLSQYLNPATIRPGASSHPYDFELFSNGVVKFTFENIMLPDSSSNEAASHGFVQFSISQRENLPIGTEINNEAAIFFDFNSPVITNETLHTIGENFITVGVGSVLRVDVSIEVCPNPFESMTTFKLKGTNLGNAFLQVFDAMGRTIRTEQFNGMNHQFYRKNLPSGLYFYNIHDENGILNSGKIIVQ